MFLTHRKDSLFYTCEDKDHPDFICVFSNRNFNYDLRAAESREESGAVIRARKALLEKFGLDLERAVFLQQVHGARIAFLHSPVFRRGGFAYTEGLEGTDAAITDLKNVPLCLLSADCLPVFFFSPRPKVIGIAHAGWKGTGSGIVSAVIEKMTTDFGCRPDEVKVGFGPGIRSCCYEVGVEFKKYFSAQSIVEKESRLFLDLAAENVRRLIAAGVKRINIFDAKICTACENNEFFSYRRGDGKNRMLTIVCRT